MLSVSAIGYHQHQTVTSLHEIAVPPRGKRSSRWQGIQHGEFVTTLQKVLDNLFHCQPLDERYFVSPNGSAMIGGFELARDGQPCQLDPTPTSPNCQITACLGFRHSNDSRHGVTVLAGGRVSLCSNGCAFGETKIRHRHTSGLRLYDWLVKGLRNFWDKLTSGWDRLKSLTNYVITTRHHDDLLLAVARHKILHWRTLGDLDRLWRNSQQRNEATWLTPDTVNDWTFGGTAWDWYNAVTYLIKRLSPSSQYRSLHALTNLLLSPDYFHPVNPY